MCWQRQIHAKVILEKKKIKIYKEKCLPSSACTQFQQIAAHSDVTMEEGQSQKMKDLLSANNR